MERRECSVPCDGINCARARMLRKELKNQENIHRDEGVVWKSVVMTYERRINDGGCLQPDKLREAISEVTRKIDLPKTGDLRTLKP